MPAQPDATDPQAPDNVPQDVIESLWLHAAQTVKWTSITLDASNSLQGGRARWTPGDTGNKHHGRVLSVALKQSCPSVKAQLAGQSER